MHRYNDVKEVQLEVTSKCNLDCPMCARNIFSGFENPNLPNAEITLDEFKEMFPIDFIKKLNFLYMAGTYGDPMVARDTLEIFKYLRDVNPYISLGINTNGSGRSYHWWKELGSILNREYDSIHFSIDGLEDTNHLYRVGARWEKIMESIKGAVDGGGTTWWDFLLFKHNEHQVDQAMKLSKDLGIKHFQYKETGRFIRPQIDDVEMVKMDAWPVYDKNGNLLHWLEPSSTEKSVERYEQVLGRKIKILDKSELKKMFPEQINWSSLSENQNVVLCDNPHFLDNMPIKCKSIAKKHIFVTAQGHIFPCCWTAYFMNAFTGKEYYEQYQIRELIKEYGSDNFNAKKTPLQEILDGNWFDQFESTWSTDGILNGKLKCCARNCGMITSKEHKFSPGEFRSEPL